MGKICIRFNKSRGMAGRGTMDHVWRVFDDDKEFLVKNVQIGVSSWGEKTGEDWSICCVGSLHLDRSTSTAIVSAEQAGNLA